MLLYVYCVWIWSEPVCVQDDWLPVNIFYYFLYLQHILDVATTCRICIAPKPPRCHHCTICNKCVLKMDHHCRILFTYLWINLNYDQMSLYGYSECVCVCVCVCVCMCDTLHTLYITRYGLLPMFTNTMIVFSSSLIYQMSYLLTHQW